MSEHISLSTSDFLKSFKIDSIQSNVVLYILQVDYRREKNVIYVKGLTSDHLEIWLQAYGVNADRTFENVFEETVVQFQNVKAVLPPSKYKKKSSAILDIQIYEKTKATTLARGKQFEPVNPESIIVQKTLVQNNIEESTKLTSKQDLETMHETKEYSVVLRVKDQPRRNSTNTLLIPCSTSDAVHVLVTLRPSMNADLCNDSLKADMVVRFTQARVKTVDSSFYVILNENSKIEHLPSVLPPFQNEPVAAEPPLVPIWNLPDHVGQTVRVCVKIVAPASCEKQKSVVWVADYNKEHAEIEVIFNTPSAAIGCLTVQRAFDIVGTVIKESRKPLVLHCSTADAILPPTYC